jgi:hypothetical protein
MHSVCTKSSELLRNHVARGTRIQLGRNGSETTTDKGAPTTRPLLHQSIRLQRDVKRL